MPAKKKEDIPVTNSNINNNINNINVHVTPSNYQERNVKKDEKPNWVLKAIVIVLIGMLIPFIWNYIKDALEGGHGEPPVIYSKPLQEIH